MAELKKKVVRGFTWNVAEKIASALFQAWAVVNVANRLVPEDYALVGILAAFVAVFNTFVDSGFLQALIRKKDPLATDFSSAFWFNMGMSAVIYGVLVALSYPTAAVLDMPRLVQLAPVLFLIVPLNAFGIIQQTVLTRAFDFKRLSAITFAATVCSWIVAVTLAVGGFGAWALVGQRLSIVAFKAIFLWIFGRWEPSFGFSGASIREMFGYSSRLLGTDFLNNLYNNVPQFIIGRIHQGTLGHYEQARKLRDLLVNSTMTATQSVTFPALAAIGDDDDKFASAVGRVVGSIVFLMFPMMAGLIVVADDLFDVFLAPQWHASVPFLRVLCLVGFVTPLAVVSSNILRTRSDGKAVIRAEVVKKTLATLVLAATIPFGAFAIACGIAGIAFTDAAVSFTVARRYSSYGFGALARDVLPTLALALVMAGAVWGVGLLVSPFAASFVSYSGLSAAFSDTSSAAPKIVSAVVLAVKIATGVIVYLGGAALLRLDAFKEFTGVVRKVLGKR